MDNFLSNLETGASETLDFSDVSTSETIAPGDYEIAIKSLEMKDSKTGGKYFNVCFQVVDGEFKGKTFFEMYNMVNSNPTAVQIGRSKFKQMVAATGWENPDEINVTKLTGRTLVARIGEKSDDYGDKNFIKSIPKKASKHIQDAVNDGKKLF